MVEEAVCVGVDVDHTIGKALDIFNIKHNLFERWSGIVSEEGSFLLQQGDNG